MRRIWSLVVLLIAFALLSTYAIEPRSALAARPPRGPVKVLADDTAGQDQRFAAAFQQVESWIGQKAFPGAVIAVGQHGQLLALKSFGNMDYTSHNAMPRNAVFDLASLSKVIGTTTAAAVLYDRKQLDLDAPVAKYIPEFAGTTGHEKVLVRHLLSHSSGLTARRVLWKETSDGPGIMKLVYTLPLVSEPGEKAQYSDYNMILMGEIVYRISGQHLDQFLARNVFKPLRMKDTGYNPPAKLMRRIPPTEQDEVLRHRLIQGVVHDENAFVLGGVSGHAGLFSTAGDLASFAQMYLNHGTYKHKQILSRETIDLWTQRQLLPPGSTRALGWDTTQKDSFAGDLASPRAIIHTGFTGTSIYIDPERDAFIILLTNRVHPTRQNLLISKARPAIHSAVLAALDRE